MNLAEEFRAWALDPGRTNDELFTAELLVEAAQLLEDHRQRVWHRDYDVHRERCKQRRLN